MYIEVAMSAKKTRHSPDLVPAEVDEIFKVEGSASQETQEIDLTADDLATEPMAFLQGLNSGNLMQFSQQSVLRDMMLQDIKSQISSLPKLVNHNNGGYQFDMVLDVPPKSHWLFSKPLNKIYIRMNKTFNIDVKFKTKLPIQPLNLRAFLCFDKDVSGPVLRCQNHLSTDPIRDNQSMRESLLRCENPNTAYCGTSQGKSIEERYSVLVPLNMSRSSHQGGGFVRQTLAFSFACQNSCFGRKETCLVFCLENSSGDVLGQQVFSLKICTCPKRDRNQDERHLGSNKCKPFSGASEDDEVLPTKRLRRRTNSSYVKEENESNDSIDVPHVPSDWEVTQTVDGDYRLVINIPKKELLLHSIEGMLEKTAVETLRNPQDTKLIQHAKHLLDFKKIAQKLP